MMLDFGLVFLGMLFGIIFTAILKEQDYIEGLKAGVKLVYEESWNRDD